jgi:uncharacterized protein with FMN-binding domain
MKRGCLLNKKAQQEMSLGTIIFIVISLIAAALIIYIVSQGLGVFEKYFKQAELDATVVQQKCGGLIGVGDICTEKIEKADDTYVTCSYAIYQVSDFEGASEIKTKCSDPQMDAIKVCNRTKDSEREKWTDARAKKVVVNGQSCFNLGVKANCDLISTQQICEEQKDTCKWENDKCTILPKP